MSSKKKRIAKGFGASAVVIATVISGISFGGAAFAAENQPRAITNCGGDSQLSICGIDNVYNANYWVPYASFDNKPSGAGWASQTVATGDKGGTVAYILWSSVDKNTWAPGTTRTLFVGLRSIGATTIPQETVAKGSIQITRPGSSAPDPIANGGVAAQAGPTTALKREQPTKVRVGAKATAEYNSADFSVTATAPAGTSWAPDQTSVEGAYATAAAGFVVDSSLKLTNVTVDGDVLTGKFTSSGGFVQGKNYQLAWYPKLNVSSDAAAGEQTVSFGVTGRTNRGNTAVNGGTKVTIPESNLTAVGSFPEDNSQRAQITGTAEAGAEVVFTMGAVEVDRVTAGADGSYTWNVPAPMQGGTKTYTVSQIVDGTESGNVEVDLNYGTAVSITSPVDGAAADQGTTTVTGRGENGSSVTVGVNGADLAPVAVANGTWSIQADLRRGVNTITATQKSKGANSTTSSVTVNPGAVDVELTAAGRFDAQDETLPATAFGSAPTGSTVILRNSVGQEIGRTVAVDDAYEIAIEPSRATAGVNSFSVVVEGDEATVKSFTLDYGRFAAVVVTKPEKNGTVEPGTVEFAGTGQPGARVVVRGSSRVVATATVEADGSWTASNPDVPMTAGMYDLYFDQVGKGGLTRTIRHAFTIDDGAPIVTPHTVTAPAPGEVLDTLVPEFRGTGHEGATITVRGSNRVVATGIVRNGMWVAQTDPAAPLTPATYDLYVDQSVRGTVTGTIRVAFSISKDAFRELTLSAPAQEEVVTTVRPTFVGTATPGAEIRVGSSRRTVATATVAADGTWRAPADFDLERGGTYAGLEVKQTTKSGKTSTVSSTFKVDRNAQ